MSVAAVLLALAFVAGALVGATQSVGVALLVAAIIGVIGLGLRDRASSVLELATRPAVRLSRVSIWFEALGISAVSGAVFFCAIEASDRITAPDLHRFAATPRIVAAVFVSGVIALFALLILSVSGFRSDTWKPRDDRFGRTLARSASGGLLALALSSTPFAYFVPYAVAFFLVAVTLVLALRQFRQRQRRVDVPAPAELAFLTDETLSEETRAEIVRRMIGDAISSQDVRLGDWLPGILARPMSPTLEAALFGAMALAPSEVSEPLLAKLLANPSPVVQSKAAHLLAWFGTRNAIEQLKAVTGPGSDAAVAAVARIKSRATTADEGRLSIVEPDGGSLSLSEGGSLSLVPSREPKRQRV